MRQAPRLVLAMAIVSLFCGVAALAEAPVPLDSKCNLIPPGHDNGRGKKTILCEPFCGSCQRLVCDGPGVCNWHCEPIPGCSPA